ncbi:GTP-binding protein Rho1 [Thoreauomyces humboldtii]|nr:GTP-binding protein Rho1 [Thoreauomyces humboldtii]
MPPPPPSSRQRKLVIVGDEGVGKTALIHVHCRAPFPVQHVSTVSDTYTTPSLSLWDTAGTSDFDRLRPFSYDAADAFLVAFAVDDPLSLENVEDKWASEVRYFSARIPILLVGCKADLRDDEDARERSDRTGLGLVTRRQGEEVAERIGAYAYVECSARTGQGVRDVFEETRLSLDESALGGGWGDGDEVRSRRRASYASSSALSTSSVATTVNNNNNNNNNNGNRDEQKQSQPQIVVPLASPLPVEDLRVQDDLQPTATKRTSRASGSTITRHSPSAPSADRPVQDLPQITDVPPAAESASVASPASATSPASIRSHSIRSRSPTTRSSVRSPSLRSASSTKSKLASSIRSSTSASPSVKAPSIVVPPVAASLPASPAPSVEKPKADDVQQQPTISATSVRTSPSAPKEKQAGCKCTIM